MPLYNPTSLGTSPTITSPNIVGSSTNDAAAAGSVGELLSTTVLVGAAVALTSTVAANIATLSLTAGDWEASGTLLWSANVASTLTSGIAAISTTSATLPTAPAGGYAAVGAALAGATFSTVDVGLTRVSVASTTNVYLVCTAVFGINTLAGYGIIRARRVR